MAKRSMPEGFRPYTMLQKSLPKGTPTTERARLMHELKRELASGVDPRSIDFARFRSTHTRSLRRNPSLTGDVLTVGAAGLALVLGVRYLKSRGGGASGAPNLLTGAPQAINAAVPTPADPTQGAGSYSPVTNSWQF